MATARLDWPWGQIGENLKQDQLQRQNKQKFTKNDHKTRLSKENNNGYKKIQKRRQLNIPLEPELILTEK